MIEPTFSRGSPGSSGSWTWVKRIASRAAMARIIRAIASTPCSFLLMWVARPRVWITTSMVPVCLVRMVRAP